MVLMSVLTHQMLFCDKMKSSLPMPAVQSYHSQVDLEVVELALLILKHLKHGTNATDFFKVDVLMAEKNLKICVLLHWCLIYSCCRVRIVLCLLMNCVWSHYIVDLVEAV